MREGLNKAENAEFDRVSGELDTKIVEIFAASLNKLPPDALPALMLDATLSATSHAARLIIVYFGLDFQNETLAKEVAAGLAGWVKVVATSENGAPVPPEAYAFFDKLGRKGMQ